MRLGTYVLGAMRKLPPGYILGSLLFARKYRSQSLRDYVVYNDRLEIKQMGGICRFLLSAAGKHIEQLRTIETRDAR